MTRFGNHQSTWWLRLWLLTIVGLLFLTMSGADLAASALVGVASVMVGVAALWLQRRTGVARDDRVLDRAADRLARAVRQQWTDEVARRRLRHPEPIRVRWSSTGRPVSAPPAGVRAGLTAGPSGRLMLHGDVSGVAALVDRLPARQLVIIGAPGSGKTVLAVLFTVAQSDRVVAGGAVPVLFTVAGWDPRKDHLHSWLSQRIADEYPMLLDYVSYGENAPDELVRSGRVLPVLDGLDEMPSALVPVALAALDDALAGDHGLVLTCRSREYEAAVAATATPLARAAVVEIEPVRPEHAIRFLVAAGVGGDTRWRAVTELLCAGPTSAVARAMSSPLMISLARSVSCGPGRHPAELCDTRRFPTSETIERHLLEQYVPAVYADRPPAPGGHGPATHHPPERAERWLGLLAHHLSDRTKNPNLAWWQLGRAVPPAVLGLLSGLAAVLVMMAAALLMTIALWAATGATPFLVDTSFLLAPTMVVVAANAARAARAEPAHWSLREVVALLFRAVRDACAAVVIAVLALSWTPDPLPLITAAIAGITSVATGAMTLGRSGQPRRFSLRLNRLGRSAGEGLAAGLLAGPVIGIGIGLVNHADPGAAGLALINGVAVTIAVGATVGLTRWLQTPVDQERTLHPRSVLRADRRATLAVATAVGLSVGVCLAAVFLAFDLVNGAPLEIAADYLVLVIPLFVMGAVAASILAAFASGSAWMIYSVARTWLALWQRLPWRLMRFLDDAHDRGVLRQVGASYQLRHARLQETLASRHAARRAGTLTGRFVPALGLGRLRDALTAGVTLGTILLGLWFLALDFATFQDGY